MAITFSTPGQYTLGGISAPRRGIAESFQAGIKANLGRQHDKQVMRMNEQKMALDLEAEKRAKAQEARAQAAFKAQQAALARAEAIRKAQFEAAQSVPTGLSYPTISVHNNQGLGPAPEMDSLPNVGTSSGITSTPVRPHARPTPPTAGLQTSMGMTYTGSTGRTGGTGGVQVASSDPMDAFRLAFEANPEMFGVQVADASGAVPAGVVPTRAQELADYAQSLVRMQGSYTREDLSAAGFTDAEIAVYEAGITQPGLTPEVVADIEARYGPLQTPQGGSPAIVNIQRDIATQLADPNLTPETRRALETRQTALDIAVRTGYGITDAVTDAAALLQRVGTRALEYGVGVPLSIASPELGGQFYEQVGRWDQTADELARMGETIPGPMLSEQPSSAPPSVMGEQPSSAPPSVMDEVSTPGTFDATKSKAKPKAKPAQDVPPQGMFGGVPNAFGEDAAVMLGEAPTGITRTEGGLSTTTPAAQEIDIVAAQTDGNISDYYLRNPAAILQTADNAYREIQSWENLIRYYRKIGDLNGVTQAQTGLAGARQAFVDMSGQLALAGMQIGNYGPLQMYFQNAHQDGTVEVRPYTNGEVEIFLDGESILRMDSDELFIRMAKDFNQEYRAGQAALKATQAELKAKAIEQTLETQGAIALEKVKNQGQIDLKLLEAEIARREGEGEVSLERVDDPTGQQRPIFAYRAGNGPTRYITFREIPGDGGTPLLQYDFVPLPGSQ